MTEQPMVRFENVSKRYGSLTVLDGLDLEIKRGEKVSVIGPSGLGQDHRAAHADDAGNDQ